MEMAARVLLKIRMATAERDRVTLHVVCVTLRWKPSRHSLFELVSEVAEQLQLPQTAKGVILRSLLATMDELTYGGGVLMPLKPVVKKQSLHRESLPLRLNWIVPMTKGQQLAVSFTYHPGLDDTDVVSASIDQAISKETMKETKEMMKETKESIKTYIKEYLDVINDMPITFLLLYGNHYPLQGTAVSNRLSRRRSLAKMAPSPHVIPAIEVSMVKGSNEDPFLEYRIPEPLLDPQTMTKDNILQFRIPIY
ncbi:hypothetical protein WA538_001235, partial [Blastocystis sp. DL]